MAIRIEKTHHLGREEAHRRFQSIEPELKQKYGVSLNWQGDRAEVKGSGVSGFVLVDDERVAVDLNLGLMLRPAQGRIKSRIEQRVNSALS